MKVFKKILLLLFTIIFCWLGFGVAYYKWAYHSIYNPEYDFQITGNLQSDTTIVGYTSYGCLMCKNIHKVVKETFDIRKDVRYIMRPVLIGDEKADRLTAIVLWAGLQGRFWEFHNAFMEYPEIDIPDEFIEELTQLYGLNFDQVVDTIDNESYKIANDNLNSMASIGVKSLPVFIAGKEAIYITQVPELRDMLEMVTRAEK